MSKKNIWARGARAPPDSSQLTHKHGPKEDIILHQQEKNNIPFKNSLLSSSHDQGHFN